MYTAPDLLWWRHHLVSVASQKGSQACMAALLALLATAPYKASLLTHAIIMCTYTQPLYIHTPSHCTFSTEYVSCSTGVLRFVCSLQH